MTKRNRIYQKVKLMKELWLQEIKIIKNLPNCFLCMWAYHVCYIRMYEKDDDRRHDRRRLKENTCSSKNMFINYIIQVFIAYFEFLMHHHFTIIVTRSRECIFILSTNFDMACLKWCVFSSKLFTYTCSWNWQLGKYNKVIKVYKHLHQNQVETHF